MNAVFWACDELNGYMSMLYSSIYRYDVNQSIVSSSDSQSLYLSKIGSDSETLNFKNCHLSSTFFINIIIIFLQRIVCELHNSWDIKIEFV